MFCEKFTEVSKYEFSHIMKKYDQLNKGDMLIQFNGDIMRIINQVNNEEVAFARKDFFRLNQTRYYVLHSLISPHRIH
jgi:hypothetical protein